MAPLEARCARGGAWAQGGVLIVLVPASPLQTKPCQDALCEACVLEHGGEGPRSEVEGGVDCVDVAQAAGAALSVQAPAPHGAGAGEGAVGIAGAAFRRDHHV